MIPATRLKIGSRLVALAFGISLLMWSVHAIMLATGERTGSSQGLGTSISVVAIAAAGLAIAVGPLSRAKIWAFWVSLAPWVLLGGAKIATDPACTTHFLSLHGCHTLMGTLVVAVIGFIIAAKPIFSGEAS